MDPITLSLLITIASLIVYAIHRANEKNKYWANRGIPYLKPTLFFGNQAQILFQRKHFTDQHMDIAKQFPNEPYVGFYDFTNPVLLFKDPQIVEKILIKDFMHFSHRGFTVNRKDAFDINLFSLEGKEWRALRYKLSPLFATAKLKKMYGTMADCGNELYNFLESDVIEDVDLKEILGRFAMDVIGSCAFGLDAKTLSNPDNEFRKMGRKTFEFGTTQILKFALLLHFPTIAKWLRISVTDRVAGEYFCKIIKDTIDYRKQNNVVRNDFLQQLMILKEKGSIELQIKDPADDYLRMEPTVESVEINEDIMIGQAFSFLTAGFEATATSIMFTLYELSKNPDLQDKAREEVQKVTEAEGALTYDTIKRMSYLEQCIKETLRKYPPASTLIRQCTKDYTLPDGTLLKTGDSVQISVRIIHNDPRYYPEPEQFRPERFGADQTIPSCAYLPFGNGPRICIAMRFALLEISYSVAKLLMRYEFKLSPKTKPFKYYPKAFITMPANPILFNIRKITSTI